MFSMAKSCLLLFLRLDEVETMEQLKDVYSHFMLYYKNDIPAMWEAKRKKSQSAEGEGADGETKVTPQKQKVPAKRDLYTICRQAGKRLLVEAFALLISWFALCWQVYYLTLLLH